MNSYLRDLVKRGLVVPLSVVLVLAAALGFVAGRQLSGDPLDDVTQVIVVDDQTITPAPSPTASPSPAPRTTTRDPRCPAGCECDITDEKQVVLCRG